MTNAPKLTAVFKPRAEANLLSRLVQDAWTAKNASLRAACESLGVMEKIADLFARLYPAADMAVLRKYGQAREIKQISVRIYNPATSHWDYYTVFDLPAALVVPDGFSQMYACGPRFSEEPNYGVKPEYRAQMSPEEWQKLVDGHDHADARRLPKETEVFFADLMAAQNAFRAEYSQATNWPQEHKAQTGAWPTWEAIANQFPVVGEYIRNLASESAADDIREAA